MKEAEVHRKIIALLFLLIGTFLYIFTGVFLRQYGKRVEFLRGDLGKTRKTVETLEKNIYLSKSEKNELMNKISQLEKTERKLSLLKRNKHYSSEGLLDYKMEPEKSAEYLPLRVAVGKHNNFPGGFFLRTENSDPMNAGILKIYTDDFLKRNLLENTLKYNGDIHRAIGLLNYVNHNPDPESGFFLLQSRLDLSVLERYGKNENPFKEEEENLCILKEFYQQIQMQMEENFPGGAPESNNFPTLTTKTSRTYENENFPFKRESANASYLNSYFLDSAAPFFPHEIQRELTYEDLHIRVRGLTEENNNPIIIEIMKDDRRILNYFARNGRVLSAVDEDTGEILYLRDDPEETPLSRWAQMAEFVYSYWKENIKSDL